MIIDDSNYELKIHCAKNKCSRKDERELAFIFNDVDANFFIEVEVDYKMVIFAYH